MSQVEQLFQKAFTLDTVVFRYLDDENDVIDIESEDEYKEAVRLALLNKEQLLRLQIDRKGKKPEPNILKEVSDFLTQSFQDTNKIVNQESLSQLYSNVVERVGDLEAQKKFNEMLSQVGGYLNQLGTGQSFNVKPVDKPIVVEPVKKQCIPSARVVRDVTGEAGSEIEAGSEFLKIWKVKNTGKDSWQGVSIVYLGGSEELGIPLGKKFPIPLAKPEEEVDVSVLMKSPNNNGVIKASFRLITSEGEEFGNKLDLSLVVVKKKVMELVKEELVKIDKSKWTTQLAFLRDMGFPSEDTNVVLLEQFKGDLTAVVQKILGN